MEILSKRVEIPSTIEIAVLENIDTGYYFKQPTMPDGSPAFSTQEERGDEVAGNILRIVTEGYTSLIKSRVNALTVLRENGIPFKICLFLAKKMHKPGDKELYCK